ncbi:ornithine cyclodeaminase [Vibrio sp. A1-b2]|uniref:ornithine cyclodeaminase n=1 Tax=Vibrio sp. A1-b2 TaxID=2912248 RepID=UPI001F36FDBF|nr:ornithine cyclodeaminase [Vibrio sp. A1-b2]
MSTFILSAKEQVPFLGVKDVCKLISAYGIEAFLKDLAQEIEQDFIHWEHLDKSNRYASHSADGVIELMPISDGTYFSCKTVNGHPNNYLNGLQTVAAFGVLSDVASGYPILISEMCLLTALRTAATSALVATYLAPKHREQMTLIGNGAQSEFQALAFRALLGINRVCLYDIDHQASVKAYNNLRSRGFDVVIHNSVNAAVANSQIITTCTADKKYAQILDDSAVKPGIHINAIGGDCPGKTELNKNILTRSTVFVEYTPQTRIEGEIQQMPDDFAVTELHDLFTGNQMGRRSEEEITLFDGVGFASEDLSVLRFIRNILTSEQYVKKSELQTLDIVSNQIDPKNLFSLFQ